jgi:hypothetical protein
MGRNMGIEDILALIAQVWTEERRHMLHMLDEIIATIVGALVIVFHKAFAEEIVRWWNENFDMRYGESDKERFAWLAILCGLIFLAYGLGGLV